jgi:hypothetical protein
MLWNGNACVKSTVILISREPSPLQIMLDQNKLHCVEYFNYVGSMITDDARCAREIKSRIAMAKAAFNRRIIFQLPNWTQI